MSLIVDSSMAAAWAYADEATDAIRHVLELVTNQGAWPHHFGDWRLRMFSRWVCGADDTMLLSAMLL